MQEDAEVTGLPQLNYNPHNNKWKLYSVVFLFVLESSLLPIALFYGLWYGTNLRHGIRKLTSPPRLPLPLFSTHVHLPANTSTRRRTSPVDTTLPTHPPSPIPSTPMSETRPLTAAPQTVFAIITALFGLVTGLEFGLRCLKLIHKNDTHRPIDGTRWRFDFTHWTLSVAYTIMTALLIAASVPHEPLVRPLALPVSYFFIQVGSQLIWSGVMHKMGKRAPFKISSVAKGERMPPMVLTILEDIIGVDGGGGQAYRRRLLARYEASEAFRDLIVKMNWFWGIGAVLDGIATVVVIWTVPEVVAYGVGEYPLSIPWLEETGMTTSEDGNGC